MYGFRLERGERLLKRGEGCMSVEDSTVLGTLFLTNQRLIFVGLARRPLTSVAAVEIPLEHIDTIKTDKTLKLIANAIRVTTIRGGKFTFLVSDRDRWVSAISEQSDII